MTLVSISATFFFITNGVCLGHGRSDEPGYTWSAGEGISLLIKYLSIDMRRDTQEDYTIEMCTYIADLLLVVT